MSIVDIYTLNTSSIVLCCLFIFDTASSDMNKNSSIKTGYSGFSGSNLDFIV